MFRFLKKYWLYALLAPLFMIGEVIMDLVQPQLMSTIVDEGVLGLSNQNVGDLGLILVTGLKMIGFVAIGGLCGVLCGVFTNICSQNFGNDMRKAVFRRVMALSFEQTDQFSTGSLVTRVTNDVTQIQNMVAQCIRGFVRNIMLFGGGVVCMLTLDLSFGVVVACAFPFLLICVVFFISRVNPLFFLLQKKLDRVNSVMQENVSGSRVVKAYVREEYEKKHKKELTDEKVLETISGVKEQKPLVSKSKGGIVVQGINDLAVHFSKCCNPVPGDEIVGFVTRGRGISIHRTDCVNIINLPEEDRSRLIDAEWNTSEEKDASELYSAEIQIYANNRSGVLLDISKIFTENNIDVSSMTVRTSRQGTATISVGFEIKGVEQLQYIVNKIRNVESVLDVERTTG